MAIEGRSRKPPPLAGRDMDARDIAFVRGVAYKFRASTPLSDDEALSCGLVGYWKAGLRYRAADGPWLPYAALRIRGEILDGGRAADHLTRSQRAAVQRGDGTVALHRPTSLSQGAPGFTGQSASSQTLEDLLPDPAAGPERIDQRLTIDAAFERIHRVHPRAAAVLRLTYEQDWPAADIAELFGVTVSRVSQLRTLGHELLAELLPRDLLEAA